jgi:hypothetical protein
LQNMAWRPLWQEHDLMHSHTQMSRLDPRATTFNPVFGASNIHYSSSGSNELASSLFSRKSKLVSWSICTTNTKPWYKQNTVPAAWETRDKFYHYKMPFKRRCPLSSEIP